jgi:hypothetical protein
VVAQPVFEIDRSANRAKARVRISGRALFLLSFPFKLRSLAPSCKGAKVTLECCNR